MRRIRLSAIPVIYMHDGENLFDASDAKFGVEWGIDEVMARLVATGEVRPAIIVGIWSLGAGRYAEYMPQKAAPPGEIDFRVPSKPVLTGRQLVSDQYLGFLVTELKPFIDSTYRTLPGRDDTFVMGSSMGGLISAYAVAEYPGVFGAAACVSTHWPAGDGVVIDYLADHLPDPASHRFYFDFGTATLDALYEPYQRRMDEVMRQAGYTEGENWLTLKFDGAEHNETSWRRRAAPPPDVPYRCRVGDIGDLPGAGSGIRGNGDLGESFSTIAEGSHHRLGRWSAPSCGSPLHRQVWTRMPRRPRIHAPGAFYHVTLRGNHRKPIFFCDDDRVLLNRIVADTLERCQARLHAYCWMGNHVHMLIQIGDLPLGRAVLRIASGYARTVQARLETTGHLFERRYHAVLVDADRYLLSLLRYIHLNPVRAGLAARPGDYRWSSHHNYTGSRHEAWVTTEFALGLLGRSHSIAVERYGKLLNAQLDESESGSPLADLHQEDDRILGDDRFLAQLRQTAPSPPRASLTIDDLIDEAGRRFGLELTELASATRDRQSSRARAWIGHEAATRNIATPSEVARALRRDESSIRQLVARHFPRKA